MNPDLHNVEIIYNFNLLINIIIIYNSNLKNLKYLCGKKDDFDCAIPGLSICIIAI